MIYYFLRFISIVRVVCSSLGELNINHVLGNKIEKFTRNEVDWFVLAE